MKSIVLLDGGVGQEIYRRAGKPAHPMWSVEVMINQPDLVREVHKDFIRAGASVITINSYTCTPTRLKRDGDPTPFASLQNQAATIAATARAELGSMAAGVQIAGCLPPLFASYTADKRSFATLKEEYKQIVAVQDPLVDIFLIETISSIKEARAAVEAAQPSGKAIYLSFTLSDTEAHRLRSGETIGAAMQAMSGYPLGAVMINCSLPETIQEGLQTLKQWHKPFGAYANAFTSVAPLKPGGTVDQLSGRADMDQQQYAQHAMAWIRQGASLIGGCCEVSPSHIDYLRQQIQAAGYNLVSLNQLHPPVTCQIRSPKN